MTIQQLLTDDIWRKIYEYDYSMIPVNRVSRYFVNNRRNEAAVTIQRFVTRNKIFDKLPVMFMSDFYSGAIPKWMLIRIYIKFYPKTDLCDLPNHILRSNYNMNDIMNDKYLRALWFRFNRPHKYLVENTRKFELFEVMNRFTLEEITHTGF
jgi:hypothetical protein